LRARKCPRYPEIKEWLGGSLDPEALIRTLALWRCLATEIKGLLIELTGLLLALASLVAAVATSLATGCSRAVRAAGDWGRDGRTFCTVHQAGDDVLIVTSAEGC
jgi:hypothetical protein